MPGKGPPSQEVLSKLPGGDEFAAGKKVYADNNCANCHKLGETGGGAGRKGGGPGGPGGPGGGGPRGPELTQVGADAEHTKQWLADHIRDPKKHKPQSRMPAFGPDRLSDADLAKLVDYLVSRK
jgi:mono/diheme cytochrome c family protein